MPDAQAAAASTATGGAVASTAAQPATAAPAAAATAQPAAATGTPQTAAWLTGQDNESVAYAASRGWDKSANPAADILTSYRNLEKLFGADKAGNTVALPTPGADKATLDGFYMRLGRPAAPDKYTAKEFNGMPKAVSDELVNIAFENGLTDKQVAALHKWHTESGAKIQNQHKIDAGIQKAAQETRLNQEWGAAAKQNLQIAKEAAAKLGWTQQHIDAMQISLGYDGVMKLAHSLGVQIGEGKWVDPNGGRQGQSEGAMTPEQAKAALKALPNDKQFMEAWQNKSHPGHKEAMDKKAQLSAWAASGGDQAQAVF